MTTPRSPPQDLVEDSDRPHCTHSSPPPSLGLRRNGDMLTSSLVVKRTPLPAVDVFLSVPNNSSGGTYVNRRKRLEAAKAKSEDRTSPADESAEQGAPESDQVEEEDKKRSSVTAAQHEQVADGSDKDGYNYNDADAEEDAEFEIVLLSQRNRRVLISRLHETLTRGRLSLVCTRICVYLSVQISQYLLLDLSYAVCVCVCDITVIAVITVIIIIIVFVEVILQAWILTRDADQLYTKRFGSTGSTATTRSDYIESVLVSAKACIQRL
jgi:hypothetical protein